MRVSSSRPSVDRIAITLVLAVLLAIPPSAYASRHGRFHARPERISTDGPTLRIPGHVVPMLRGATKLPTDRGRDDDPLELTFVLTRFDQAGFEGHLAAIYDPASPSHRVFLTQGEQADRFGPARDTYDRLLAYVGAQGFELVAGSENRLTLTVRGARRAAERAFAVRLDDYEVGGTRFYSNDRDPALPADLAPSVQSIAGLSSLATVRVHPGPATSAAENQRACATSTQVSGNQVACGIGYFIVAAIYDALCILGGWISAAVNGQLAGCLLPIFPGSTPIPTPGPPSSTPAMLRGAALAPPPPQIPTGAGQKIGIVAFDSFKTSDVADLMTLVGAPADRIDHVHEVKLNGGAPLGANQSEVLLDVNTILLLAPGADVTVYSAPFAGPNVSFQTIFNAMIDDGMTIISNSWAYCENQTTLADVQSIDTIFESAAAAGISVFNSAGDTGSTCLNGSANTVAVPAGAPHATAVGGSSIEIGPGGTHAGETWWNGSNAIPPTGSGGFGTSRFFARPFYQDGHSTHPKRSVPDVVVNADPAANGVPICQADAGGCPTGLVYGGTSIGAPMWAAFTALLNEAQGANLGFLNPYLYQLAAGDAFHSAADLGSDFAHVGLGSPNLSTLRLALIGAAPGQPSAAASHASSTRDPVPADGIENGHIVVQLRDAHGSAVSGKTVALTAQPSGHVAITPANGVSTTANGIVTFTVTNTVAETVTFTATDTSDGVVIADMPTVTFGVPPATSAGIAGFPATVPADGITTATITVTMQDRLGRPTPDKKIRLSQGGGHSVIDGPVPSVTNAGGQIVFTVTDKVNETVTYTAVDESDGDLPVPGSATVIFSGASTSCVNPNPPVGDNGYVVTPFATGFIAQTFSYGGVNYGCGGASHPGFRGSDVFISDFPNGRLYRFGLDGGAVSNANILTTHTPTFGFPTIGKDGKLYAAFGATTGGFTTGSIVELDPDTGAILRTVAANQTCPAGLAVDPLSGDLFFTHQCYGGGADDPALSRLRNPGDASPTVELYATLPGTPNGFIAFAPDGTLFIAARYTAQTPTVVRVDGTDVPGPPAVTDVTGVTTVFLLSLGSADANGAATSLLTVNGSDLELVDLTTATPTATRIASNMAPGVIGPDGCLYTGYQDTVYKVSRSDGSCDFVPTTALPSLTLTPAVVTPDPVQDTTVDFTAAFHNLAVAEGTPVFFTVSGANVGQHMVRTNAAGEAVFSARGRFTGNDVIVATATIDDDTFTSNPAKLTWTAGKHTTFLTLNTSPTGGVPDSLVPVVASVVDSSVVPVAPVVGVTVAFTLGVDQCSAVTDANGRATCFITPAALGTSTLGATFAGDATLLPSSDVRAFVTGGQGGTGSFALYRTAATKGAPKFVKFGAVTLADQFGSGDYDVVKPSHLGAPASTGGSPIFDALTHLESYALKRGKTSGAFAPRPNVQVGNACDDAVVTIAKPGAILVPTATGVANPDAAVDHFVCYRAKRQKKRADGSALAKFAKGTQIDVADELGTRRYDLKSLTWLCTPTSKTGTPVLLAGPTKGAPLPITPAAIENPDVNLLCYAAKLATKRIEQNGCGPVAPKAKGTKIKQAQVARQIAVPVVNQFGTAAVDTTKPALVCLPSSVGP